MGGPGLEVAKFTFYVFMPIGFMVYFGGPGFYERFVADHVFQFSPPPKGNMPTERSEISKALEEFRGSREQRRLAREQALRDMAASLKDSKRLHISKTPQNDKEKDNYPELEDILGRPAKSFSELVDQLEILIKHPNPPRNYADALAKEELRREDSGNLDAGQSKEKLAPGLVMRSKFGGLRDSLDRASQNAVHDAAVKDAGVPPSGPLSMATNIEQRQRRHIWMTKVAGYKEFHADLLSMNRLLKSLDTSRDDAAASEGSGAADTDNIGAVEEAADREISGDAMQESDREFQQLLSKSWELFDEDLATAERSEDFDVDIIPQQPRPRYDDDKPEHTIWSSRKPAPYLPSFKKRPPINKEFRPSNKRILRKGSVRDARPRTMSLIRRADQPTYTQLLKHVLENKGEHVHVPIDSSVSVGDIVEVRLNSAVNMAIRYESSTRVFAVLQKTTGRFHFTIISTDHKLLGARESSLGFVAKGLMFDENLLRKSGVSPVGIQRLLDYRDSLQAYEAEHGKAALTNAADVERLHKMQNQAVQAPAKSGYFTEPSDVNQENVSAASDDDWATAPCFPTNFDSDIAVGSSMASDSAKSAAESQAEQKDEADEDELDMMIRIMPRLTMVFRDEGLRLVRSYYRELNGYWSLALSQDKTKVTVDSVAELIFGVERDRLSNEVARLAAYTHMINDPLHFIPDDHFLFVTNTFTLRSRAEVEKIERAQNLIRTNSPVFKQFIDKARKLVAFSHAHAPSDPLRVAQSPDMLSLKESMTCQVTKQTFYPDFMPTRSTIASVIPAEHEVAAIKFDGNDQLFIDIICRYVEIDSANAKISQNPYGPLVPPILKKMRCYDGSESDVAQRFLVDIGVRPHWHNPAFGDSAITESPLRAAAETCSRRFLRGDSATVDKATAATDAKPIEAADAPPPNAPWRPDLQKRETLITQSCNGVGIIDRTQFYGRDICEDFRHDFGDLQVYTIDNAATRDVDDGISVETVPGAGGRPQTWLHIHVADPTALIHPGHVVADAAAEQMATSYYAEATKHMLPPELVMQRISLCRRMDGSPVNTMTFSARLDDDGNIIEYKVRPGRVRNVLATPYELLDRYLSYETACSEAAHSFAELQTAVRNSTLVHPFKLSSEDWRNYGEDCGTLSATEASRFQAIQRVTIRHKLRRLQDGAMNLGTKGDDMVIGLDGAMQPASMGGPEFLLDQLRHPGCGSLEYPRIKRSFSVVQSSPAHMMVAELMIIAGRVAVRYAREHMHQDRDSAGAFTEPQSIPMLYRGQQLPDLPMLSGCSSDMPLAFADMTIAEAQLAENVWKATLAETQRNFGTISLKTRDEIRHMMSPGLIIAQPGPHTSLGIVDEYGYTRITSPIRRVEDLVGHWQLKAQLLAEHTDARDKAPWFWGHADMIRLAPIAYRRQYLNDQKMAAGNEFWALTLMQRMDFEARRGWLLPPPAGFYDTNSEHYRDLPWAYYDPSKPGPLIWTGVVDNRDASRAFISLILHSGLNVRAMLMPRVIDATKLPFSGTKVRVQLMGITPQRGQLVVKLAPEQYQPPETPQFWKGKHVMIMPYSRMPSMMMLPENMPTSSPH
ncbi:3'-5' RNA exonuclease complex component [Coemansia sp. RSA 2711]|nr:3'-5' RNA exonuclease complex component [Coemansia sp. RSA 2711]